MNKTVQTTMLAIVEKVIDYKQDYSKVLDEKIQKLIYEDKIAVMELTSWLEDLDRLRTRVDEICIGHEITPEDLGFTDEMAVMLAEWN